MHNVDLGVTAAMEVADAFTWTNPNAVIPARGTAKLDEALSRELVAPVGDGGVASRLRDIQAARAIEDPDAVPLVALGPDSIDRVVPRIPRPYERLMDTLYDATMQADKLPLSGEHQATVATLHRLLTAARTQLSEIAANALTVSSPSLAVKSVANGLRDVERELAMEKPKLSQVRKVVRSALEVLGRITGAN